MNRDYSVYQNIRGYSNLEKNIQLCGCGWLGPYGAWTSTGTVRINSYAWDRDYHINQSMCGYSNLDKNISQEISSVPVGGLAPMGPGHSQAQGRLNSYAAWDKGVNIYQSMRYWNPDKTVFSQMISSVSVDNPAPMRPGHPREQWKSTLYAWNKDLQYWCEDVWIHMHETSNTGLFNHLWKFKPCQNNIQVDYQHWARGWPGTRGAGTSTGTDQCICKKQELQCLSDYMWIIWNLDSALKTPFQLGDQLCIRERPGPHGATTSTDTVKINSFTWSRKRSVNLDTCGMWNPDKTISSGVFRTVTMDGLASCGARTSTGTV